jgi:hypothetical protein
MRDEFTEDVKRALAARAGNVCSNPDCVALTSGPQDDPAKALNVGVAAHITGAAPRGPRNDRSLTPEARRSADNGIWLCQNCAKVIDNDTARFTRELLRAWKVVAEDRARRLIGKATGAVDVGPVLEMQFADLSSRVKLGTTVTVESTVVEIPDLGKIPLYGPASKTFYGIPLDGYDNIRNRDYYRDTAVYLRDRSLLKPVGVAVTNTSSAAAEEVWATLSLDAAPDLVVVDESETPCEPSTCWQPPGRPFDRDRCVQVARYGNTFEIRIRIGTVQPGTTRWSDEPFYIGARQPMTAVARAEVTANNLRAPVTLDAAIEITVGRVRASVKDITNIGAKSRTE